MKKLIANDYMSFFVDLKSNSALIFNECHKKCFTPKMFNIFKQFCFTYL